MTELDQTSNAEGFQYISCYCLSLVWVVPLFDDYDFNTSHVTVYRVQQKDVGWSEWNFNTSHVTVYPSKREGYKENIVYFNTSHVTVYRLAIH